MRALITASFICLIFASWARADGGKQTPLDLQAQANQKLKADFGAADSGLKGNNLAVLVPGELTLEGVKFKIGEGLIQLAGASTPDKAQKVTGIPVDAKFTRLHILQATQWFADEGTTVGHFTVNYDDKTQETIPIVYGRDTYDWWKEIPPKSKLKVAWKGTNDAVKKQGISLHLFLATWENKQPAKKVVSIDFDSTADTPCAPFCVALTVEE